METPATISSINKLLREAFAKTDLRDYEGALTSMEAANVLEPGNIYLDALRRHLSQMNQLDKEGELDEATRHELIGPLPGIIECAMKESKKLHEARRAKSPASAPKLEPAPESRTLEAQPNQEATPSLEESAAQKELEGLKLLYFQRASKFVMNGDYEAALAEVQRVFEVDPNNTIAKEYASKVENLLGHARMLASPPNSPSPTPVAPNIPPTSDDPGARDSQRVTAWTESFGQHKSAPPENGRQPARPTVDRKPTSQRAPNPSSQRMAAVPPSQRMHASPPSERTRSLPASQRKPSAESRQAVIYGDALNDILAATPQPQGPEADPEKSPAGKMWGLLVFTLIALGAVSSYFVFGSGKNATARNVSHTIEGSAGATMAEHRVETPVQTVASSPEQFAPAQTQNVTPVSHEAAPVSEPPAPAPSSASKRQPERESALTPGLNTGSPVAVDPAASAPDKIAPSALKAVQSDATPVVPDFIPVEKDPAIVKLVKPAYPSFLTGDGQVVIKVLIDAEGKPIETKILKSTNRALDVAAVEAVMRSQYSPAQMGQGPVAAWLTIPFKFKQAK